MALQAHTPTSASPREWLSTRRPESVDSPSVPVDYLCALARWYGAEASRCWDEGKHAEGFMAHCKAQGILEAVAYLTGDSGDRTT